MKDVYRQAALDLMLGVENSEELKSLLSTDDTDADDSEAVLVEKEENMKTLIDECECKSPS